MSGFWKFMTYHWSIIGVVPGIIGAALLSRLDRRYLPFLLMVWIGFTNDSLSYVTGKLLRSNALNTNIYSVLEATLVVWMFRRWGLFRQAWLPKALMGAYLVTAVAETIIRHDYKQFNSYSHVFHAFLSILLAVQHINRLILSEEKLNLRNGDFLICIAFVFYFTAGVISEIFWMYGFQGQKAGWFANNVYSIMSYTNVFANLIFAIALLCIPKKQSFLQLS